MLREASTAAKNEALLAAAESIRAGREEILAANRERPARGGGEGFVARRCSIGLRLDAARIEAMARGVEEIAALPDPVGRELARWTRPNGLDIARVATPIGVLGIIYESRPNVTADAGALCLKSGNAVILRGGSESIRSSAAIHAGIGAKACARRACRKPRSKSSRRPIARRWARCWPDLRGAIDLIVPRGGKSLVARVQAEARVPVLAHLEGICHTYVHARRRSRESARALS